MRKRIKAGDEFRWCMRCECAWLSGAWEQAGGCPGRECDGRYGDFLPWPEVLEWVPRYPAVPLWRVRYPLAGTWGF